MQALPSSRVITGPLALSRQALAYAKAKANVEMDSQGCARIESDSFRWLLLRESERNMSVPEGKL